MTFREELYDLWINDEIPKWFTVQNVKEVTSNLEANNLSNYCKENSGSSNKNKKVLIRRVNADGKYEYTFKNDVQHENDSSKTDGCKS